MSFVTGRTQHVSYDGQLSSIQPVHVGVPQGSVIGPLLFVLYTAGINQIVARHGLKLHQHAADCQICATTDVIDEAATVDRFSRCIADVGDCVSSSWLRSNTSETRMMWLRSRNQIDKITVHNVSMLSSSVRIVDTARDLAWSLIVS